MVLEFWLPTSRNGKRPSSSSSQPAIVRHLEELEPRITCSATPVAAQFDAVNGYGVKQITVAGRNLLVGAGFGFIGSRPGAGDTENNISSASRYSGNGIMRPFNNSAAGGHLPYSLNFTRVANDRSRINFSGSVGPSPFDFGTLSVPMDCIRSFTYWRYSGAAGVSRYDQNPYSYTSPGGGPIYIRFAPGSPVWGEIIGVDYTIRVTLNSSRPMSLAFVEAPQLGVGVRNVEFGFVGGLRKGQGATVSGTIQVFRSDVALLPKMVFESESPANHQTGRRDGEGWSARVGDPANRYLVYGPYTTAVPAGRRTATFRLMLDNTTADNNRILTIDVYDPSTGRSLKKLDITRRMFDTGAFRYKDFTLEFDATAGQTLEFRTFWYGGSYVRQDYVLVR